MKLFHGSICTIPNPDIHHARKYLDFGPAFYLTSFQAQAEKWARRQAMRHTTLPVINLYVLDDDLTGYNALSFEGTNEAWLDFVCACRRGEKLYVNYDIIKGPVADDDVFKSIDLYAKGIWTKERTLAELRYSTPNDQIAILSQDILNTKLHFTQSFVLETKE